MILLLGSTGYVGSAFEQLLQSRGETYRGISRQQIDYTDRDTFDQVCVAIDGARAKWGKANKPEPETTEDVRLERMVERNFFYNC